MPSEPGVGRISPTAWIEIIVVGVWSVIDVSEPPLVGFNDMKG